MKTPKRLTLEIGKRYVRRNGSVSDTIEKTANFTRSKFEFIDASTGKTYTPTGFLYSETKISSYDLIKEYTESAPPVAVNTNETKTCPDCQRPIAESIEDVLEGHCPKDWAYRDPDAEKDCVRHKADPSQSIPIVSPPVAESVGSDTPMWDARNDIAIPTPRMDAAIDGGNDDLFVVGCELERELSAAKAELLPIRKQLEDANEKIKAIRSAAQEEKDELEEAHEALRRCYMACGYGDPSEGEGTSPEDVAETVERNLAALDRLKEWKATDG